MSVCANAQDSTYFYYFYQEARHIELNKNEVVIFADKNPLAELEARTDWKIEPADLTPGAVAGVFFLRLPEDKKSAQKIEALVASLSEHPALKSVGPVFYDSFGGRLYFDASVTVGFKKGTYEPSEQFKILRAFTSNSQPESLWHGLNDAWRIQVSDKNGFTALQLANELAVREDVHFSEPGMYLSVRRDLIPNDPNFSSLWGLHNTGQNGGLNNFDMNAPEAWDITQGSSSVQVVVLDDGVQANHPDLNAAFGMDFTNDPSANNGEPVNTCDTHGTLVAGCISAKINNSLGVTGIAPLCLSKSARVFISMLVSPCTTSGASNTGWISNAIFWAQSSGARVTNASLSIGAVSALVDSAYATTRNLGLIHFASTGNTGMPGVGFPASSTSVLAIGAVERTGTITSFSTTGPEVDFVAPGRDVMTTDRTGGDGFDASDYALVNGTSFACPYAAGTAALILSAFPSLSPDQVTQALEQSATDLGAFGKDSTYGHGLINAHKALILANPNVTNFYGDDPFDAFGSSFAVYENYDGSGAPDFFVGSPNHHSGLGPNTGRVSILTSSLGYSPVDIDGFASGSMFGSAVCNPGDLDGDQFDDVAIAAVGTNNSAGAVYIYSGQALTAHLLLTGANPNDRFGESIAAAGDVNNDGIDDIIVGAPGTLSNTGSVTVYHGSFGTVLYHINGSQAGMKFGASVSGVGDVNGDGYDDFLVGAPDFTVGTFANAGMAYLYSGIDGTLIRNFTSAKIGDHFGTSLCSLGDLDGDGTLDVAIGAPGSDFNGVVDRGGVFVYSAFSGFLVQARYGLAATDQMGTSVSPAGDVNGDCFPDFVCGAPGHDGLAPNGGGAFVFSADSNVFAPIHMARGAEPQGFLGSVVSNAFDFNFDGFADVAAGSPNSDLLNDDGGRLVISHSPKLPAFAYTFGDPNLNLKLLWQTGLDPYALTATVILGGGTPGGTGVVGVSLAPTLFPSGVGFPLLIATDTANLIQTDPFGFDVLGALVVYNVSRQNPFLAGTTVYIQGFELSPVIQGSNGLALLLAP